jgi:hypothetical protein
MRNNTTVLVRTMMRFLIEFMEVRLPMDVSWNCTALRSLRPADGRVPDEKIEEPPLRSCHVEIELTHATGMMELCGFISRC